MKMNCYSIVIKGNEAVIILKKKIINLHRKTTDLQEKEICRNFIFRRNSGSNSEPGFRGARKKPEREVSEEDDDGRSPDSADVKPKDNLSEGILAERKS